VRPIANEERAEAPTIIAEAFEALRSQCEVTPPNGRLVPTLICHGCGGRRDLLWLPGFDSGDLALDEVAEALASCVSDVPDGEQAALAFEGFTPGSEARLEPLAIILAARTPNLTTAALVSLRRRDGIPYLTNLRPTQPASDEGLAEQVLDGLVWGLMASARQSRPASSASTHTKSCGSRQRRRTNRR
jgi:hypothetical protein